MASRTLSSVATERGLVGGPFGSNLVTNDYADTGIPVIRGANMGIRYVSGDFVYVSHGKFAKELSYNSARPGDLVFTQRGTLGQVAIVPQLPFNEYVVSQSQMRLRVNEKVATPSYVYYACRSAEFLRQINDRAISTGVPHINLGILGALRIPDRTLQDQLSITGVLGALDDKIVVNNLIRDLTDQLLSAEFGRLTDRHEWQTLKAMAQVNAGVVQPVPGGQLRYIDISAVGQGEFEMPELMPWEVAPSRARRVVRAGDTIWSTVRPNRRAHALVLDNDPMLIASTGLAVLSPQPGRTAGLYEATRNPEFVKFLKSVADGSAYPAVRGDRFAEAPIPSLSTAEWDEFERQAMPLRLRAHAAAVETRALAQTRDELLPLLMSGKIRVRDAEHIAGEVL